MKTTPLNPLKLDLQALARSGETLEGQWPLQALPRLAQSAWQAQASAAQAEPVSWALQATAAGGVGEGYWLQLKADCQLPLQCQRCLGPMAHTVEVDRRLRFVATQALAEQLDEALEEDVLALEARVDAQVLVEDELILALPLVPLHEQCSPGWQPATAPEQEPEREPEQARAAERTNPFAVLAQLKRPGGPGEAH